jgi:hypothetical protein
LKDVLPENLAAQLAVNIVDYRDDDSVPTLLTVKGTTYYGVEMTPYINEVMAWTPTPDDDGVMASMLSFITLIPTLCRLTDGVWRGVLAVSSCMVLCRPMVI